MVLKLLNNFFNIPVMVKFADIFSKWSVTNKIFLIFVIELCYYIFKIEVYDYRLLHPILVEVGIDLFRIFESILMWLMFGGWLKTQQQPLLLSVKSIKKNIGYGERFAAKQELNSFYLMLILMFLGLTYADYTFGTLNIYLAFSSIFVAIREELLFRGIFLGLMIQKTKRPVLSLWISSLLFTVWHVSSLFHAQYFVIFLYGLMLGLTYMRFKSLKLVIAIHFAIDVVAAFAANVNPVWQVPFTMLACFVSIGMSQSKGK